MSILEKFVNYLRASKEEARKVSWPSRQDTLRYSALVIGVSLVIALFFAVLDFGFTRLVDIVLLQRVGQTDTAGSSAPIQSEITTSSASVTLPTPAINQPTTPSASEIK